MKKLILLFLFINFKLMAQVEIIQNIHIDSIKYGQAVELPFRNIQKVVIYEKDSILYLKLNKCLGKLDYLGNKMIHQQGHIQIDKIYFSWEDMLLEICQISIGKVTFVEYKIEDNNNFLTIYGKIK